jgi:D-xylose transport system permease protein
MKRAQEVAPPEGLAPITGAPLKSGAPRGGGFVEWNTYGLIAALAVVWVAFNVGTDGLFLSGRNLTLLLVQAVILGIATCGIVFIMVAGHIDLSIGSAVGLVATVLAYTESTQQAGTLKSVGVALGIGLAVGAWQGLWVAYLRVPAFIVTLAGMMLLRGISYIISEGQTYSVDSEPVRTIARGQLGAGPTLVVVVLLVLVTLVPPRDRDGAGVAIAMARRVAQRLPTLCLLALIAYIALSYEGMPYAVITVAMLAGVLSFVGNSTSYGRRIYAIGGEVEAASRAGINVKRYVFFLFLFMGLIYGLDGIVLGSRLGGAPPDPALFLELNAITAAIIGGTSLFGGIGKVSTALLGALLLTSLTNGMQLMNVSSYYQYVVQGLVLLAAVFLDITLKERRTRA